MRPASAQNSKDFYLISEVASILKVSTHTIRNLENEFGIEVKKDASGKRIYTFNDIEKYKLIIEKKNSFDVSSKSQLVKSNVKSTPFEPAPFNTPSEVNSSVLQSYSSVLQSYSSVNNSITPNFSYNVSNLYSLFNISKLSKFSLATFVIATFASFGSFFFDSYMDLDSSLSHFLGLNSKEVSNVLQATDENWDYRFDVNVPAFFNNSLVGSSAAFDLITVGDRVIINPNGISAPNIINTVRTLPNEEILLVDITDVNNPIFSITNNPSFESIEVGTLNGVENLDDTTITTIENSINIPTASTDAETIGGLSVSDFLRSNTNTTFTNGIMTFDASSSLKFNNLNPNTFLRVDGSNNLVGFSILPGLNVDFTSTANSLTINVSTNPIATQNYTSIAVNTLFLGTSSFDPSYAVLSSAEELNKLFTLSGNLLTTTNLSTLFPSIDLDSANDITTANLSASILSAFPNIDTNAANDVLISSLASLMLTSYVNLDTDATNDITTSNFSSTLFSLFPNIDTNAANDVDLLQDAVLIGSNAGKNVYSENIWFGYQDFNRASASIFEVEENGKITFDGGVLPSIIDNALYSYDDILYFQQSPLALLSDHTIVNHNNRFAFFTTNASGKLQLSGSSNIGLNYIQSGAASSILGMDGSTLRYLNVTGDLSVSTTSSSNITFTFNTVNSNTGTYGSDTGIPVITVNSKGLITAVSTVPYTNVTNPNNYVTAISFSTPAVTQRIFTLQRQGLSDLTALFTITSGDITSALNYTPLRNTTDNLTGNLGVSGTFSAATGSFTNLSSQNANFSNLTLANALAIIYGGTGTNVIPANGQLLIGNGSGYSVSALTAGTNISILTGGGSITISATDTTNPNNYVTGIAFSDSSSTSKTLTLTRDGLSNLTATFSISASNVTSALGYTPFNASNFTATQIINTLGYTPLNSAAFNATNITNALGYTPFGPTNFVAGTNVSLSSTATSLTINSTFTDTTNPNNYVTEISFSDASATTKTLTLTREGLANLSASFSLSSSDITTALGYTPFNAANFTSTQIINTLGYTPLNSAAFNAANITNALGYIPQVNLGYTPLRNTTDSLTGNLGVSGNFSAATGTFTNLTLANALAVIYGGTGLTSTPNNGQLLIGNGTGYTLSALTAGTNVTISTGAGSITISAVTGGTNANNYVNAISFSTPQASERTLVLSREGLANLTASFSLSSSDITTALGYTPLRNTSDTLSGNLTITGSLSASTIFQNGNRVCDLSGNCAGAGGSILGSGSAGFISLFTATNSIASSSIFQSIGSGFIGIGTTNPTEQLDVYGAIKLSQNLGTAARSNALYQDGGVLYWNGQAVGVVGSTAPGGISGTKDYFPYFNTKDTLIASDFKYISTANERGLELVTSNKIPVYMSIGHQNQAKFKIGVAADSTGFFSNYDTEDDIILVNSSNLSTSDTIFANQNQDGKFIFTFGVNSVERRAVTFDYVDSLDLVHVGINTTLPLYALHVTGDAKISGTLAVPTFSNPNAGSFDFLAGVNFRGNLSAAIGTFTNLTLANALTVGNGGTGLSATPTAGQLLIGNGTGYTLSTLTAGTNVSISTGAGSITISAIDTTGPNNYVTAISFSDASATTKTFTLTQNGLANLTATFSISAANITSALGYTPFDSSAFNAANITNALGYLPFNAANFTSTQIINTLGYTPLNSTAFNAVNITNALGYTPFGPTNFVAGTNISLSSTATSLTINSTYVDTTGPNNYVTAISFSDASATTKTFTLTQNGLANLTATFSISVADITSALGYTPVNKAGDTIAGSLYVTNTLSTDTLWVGNGFSVFTSNDNLYLDTNNGAIFRGALNSTFTFYENANQTIATFDSEGSFFNSNLSAAIGTFTNLTLANALTVGNGGTGISATPTAGHLLIGNGTGYTLSTLTAGTNVSISTGAGSITISANDTTNPNNFVSAISFSAPASAQRVLNLARTGLSPLTADFTLNQSDIVTALGYTPLSNTSDFMTGSLGVATSFSAATGTFTNLTLANALAVIYGGTGLSNTPSVGQFLIGNGTGYTLSGLTAGTGISITTGAGSVTITSSVVDTNNYVTDISFSDASATIKSLTITQNGLSNLIASFSISSANVTSALGFTPVNRAGDTMSGSLTILQTLSAQDVVVLDNLFVGDYANSAYTLQIEPKVGTLARKIVLDLTSGSQTETTLGMFIQSVKFSAPSAAELKNLTFNQISSTNNIILDILKAGTLPAVSNGVLDTYNSQVSAASLYLAANTTNTPQIRFSSSAGVDVSSPTAGDFWWNGSELNFYNGTETINLLSNPMNFFGSQLFSGANTTLADGDYIEVAHNSNSYDVVATGWVYNTLTSKWENISANQGSNLNVDLLEYSTDTIANNNFSGGIDSIRTASGGTMYFTDSTGLNSSASPYIDGYVVHIFTGATGNQTFTTNYNLTGVSYIVAGGGGAGGRVAGGGGGGADVSIANNSITMTQGTYTITVGTGATGLAQGSTGTATAAGGAGGNSTLSGPGLALITASGGCGGAGYTTNSGACSGNGGGQGGSTGSSPVGAGNFAGGTRFSANGGGGGGAGGVGGNAVDGAGGVGGGAGGAGVTSTISGATVIYGAGGGGGAFSSDLGGAGGSSGVGGAGGNFNADTAGDGLARTGSGGGGGGYNNGNGTAYATGNGGSGVVVIRYPYQTNAIKAYSESTIKTQGSYSLKVIAGNDSLNSSLTKTFANGTLNLSYQDKIIFYMRASRTGSNVRLSIEDSGGAVNSFTPNIVAADTWQRFTWDISGEPTDRDNITNLKITIVNADAGNTFYLDEIATNLSYKIQLSSADTARLYNFSGDTQNMRLVVSAKTSALFEYALGYTPLRNDSDYMRGSLGVTGSFSAANAQFPNLFVSAFSASTAQITNAVITNLTIASNLFVTNTLSTKTLIVGVGAAIFTSDDFLRVNSNNGMIFNASGLASFEVLDDNISRFLVTGNSVVVNGYFSAGASSLGATTINGNLSAALGSFTNLGVTTALSAANANFTTLNAGSFSGTSGFMTNFGVTSALSAATATFRGTVTVSNPSGGTQLNLVSNGGSGNNIELGFYDGATKRANFSMDSTNTFEFEGTSGTNVHFNATSGTYRFFINGNNRFEVGLNGITATTGITGTTANFSSLGIGTATPSTDLEVFGSEAEMFVHFTGQSRGGLRAMGTQRIALLTTDQNDDLVFGYSSGIKGAFTERMRLDNGTGFFGIGTLNPGFPLEVVGIAEFDTVSAATGNITTRLGVNGAFSAANVGITTALSAANASFTTLNAGSFSGTSGFMTNFGVTSNFSAANVGITTLLSVPTGNFTTRLGVNGAFSASSASITNTLSVANLITSGRVGIGSSNLVAPLEITDNAAPNGVQAQLRRSGAGDLAIAFEQVGVNAFGIVHRSGSGQGIAFVDGLYYANGGTERMRILNNGNVGIGTTNPAFDLDVIGDGRFSANLSAASVVLSGSLSIGGAVIYTSANAQIFNHPTINNYSFRINDVVELNMSSTQLDINSNELIRAANIFGNATSTFAARVFSNPGAATNPQVRINATMTYMATGGTVTSDSRLKDGVATMSNSLLLISQLNPVTFNFKDYVNGNFTDTLAGRKMGFIAQEVEQVIPDLVGDVIWVDGQGYKGIEYDKMVSLLVGGIKEQQVQITSLSNAVAGMNLASMQSVYDQFMTTIENLSMSTENGALVVNTNLTVTGDSLFNNATFTGDVAIGQIKFDSLNNDISINGMDCTNIDGTLNTSLCETQTLFVMKNKAGNLNFFDGKVVINPLGEMTVEKITAGEVAAAKVKASEYQVVAGSEVSGNTQILSGQTEITILTSKVKANSKVFVTANGDLGGRSLYVSDKVEGVSFKVKLNQALSSDVNFDWFILNSE